MGIQILMLSDDCPFKREKVKKNIHETMITLYMFMFFYIGNCSLFL
jgi:hypothetical protein